MFSELTKHLDWQLVNGTLWITLLQTLEIQDELNVYTVASMKKLINYSRTKRKELLIAIVWSWMRRLEHRDIVKC